MRFFIALEIPKENLAEFQSIQSKLHTLIPQAKLTAVDKIHLTLAFLGEQPIALKEKLVSVIAGAVQNIGCFQVAPAYIDGFPNIHHPQVLWVGVKGDIDKIILIREGIKDGLSAIGMPLEERRFIPHISIAKLNNFFISRELEVKMESIFTKPFKPIRVASIKLFESIPNEGFHKHNTLAEVKLSINKPSQDNFLSI